MAIDFPGVDEYINCGSGATLDDITYLTVVGWVNTDTLTGFHIIACKQDVTAAAKGWLFYTVTITGVLTWIVRCTGATDGQWTCPGPSAGTWAHVAITHDKSSQDNQPLMYLNGGSQTVTEVGNPASAWESDAAESLWIGINSNGTSPWDGKMEDFRVFNRILSAQEVAILASGYRGPLGGEVGRWAMDGAQAITHFDGANLTVNVNYIPDMSGNANTGNPTGTPIGAASSCPRMGGITD
jgi:hypothetical protein